MIEVQAYFRVLDRARHCVYGLGHRGLRDFGAYIKPCKGESLMLSRAWTCSRFRGPSLTLGSPQRTRGLRGL